MTTQVDPVRRPQLLLLGLAASVYIVLLLVSLDVGPLLIIAGLVVSVGVAVVAFRVVPRLGRTFGAGLLGGMVAGLVVLGPGLRVAMRVVAVMDSARRPEFSVEGMVFILVITGGVMGPILGLVLALTRRALNHSLAVSAILAAVAGLTLFVANTELRPELVGLGAGPGVNLALFGAAIALYGAGAERLIRRFDRAPIMEEEEMLIETVKEGQI